MKDRMTRRLAGYALVCLLTALSALAAGKSRKPFSIEAPAYRERGEKTAKITVVEFSDFQCPACRVAEPTIRQLNSVYGPNLRFVFKHYPLRMHQWAKNGAYAAECAGKQGKFWEYHDALYDNQDEWTNEKADDFLTGYAQKLKLDMKAFEACRQDPATVEAVASDVKDGESAWVGSTPTFFVNGRRFIGGRNLAELGTIHMDKELKK